MEVGANRRVIDKGNENPTDYNDEVILSCFPHHLFLESIITQAFHKAPRPGSSWVTEEKGMLTITISLFPRMSGSRALERVKRLRIMALTRYFTEELL